MSPSLRINALNSVGDLMRTVGAVESRLAFIMNSQYGTQARASMRAAAAIAGGGVEGVLTPGEEGGGPGSGNPLLLKMNSVGSGGGGTPTGVGVPLTPRRMPLQVGMLSLSFLISFRFLTLSYLMGPIGHKIDFSVLPDV